MWYLVSQEDRNGQFWAQSQTTCEFNHLELRNRFDLLNLINTAKSSGSSANVLMVIFKIIFP